MATHQFVSAIIAAFASSQGIHLVDTEIAVEPLMGGASTARLYRFALYETSYVLRILPGQASAETRMYQISLAQQAGKIGVGPTVYFVDSQMQALVMEFIKGRTVEKSDFANADRLCSFAKLLRRLHRSTENFSRAVSPFKRFRDFYNNAVGHSFLPPRFAEVKVLMEVLEAILQRWPIAEVPSHLDLHPLNIMLANERFMLVDWVNGGRSDPNFDLATFSVFFDLSESQIQTFLANYFDREPMAHEYDRFTIIQPVRLFVIAAALYSSEGATGPSAKGLAMFRRGLEIIDQIKFHSACNRMMQKRTC